MGWKLGAEDGPRPVEGPRSRHSTGRKPLPGAFLQGPCSCEPGLKPECPRVCPQVGTAHACVRCHSFLLPP